MRAISRREFLGTSASAAALSLSIPVSAESPPFTASMEIPSHLRGFEHLWKIDPRAASRAWFREAKFGLFIHYGLYSLIGRGEWVQLLEKIPVREYAKVQNQFFADKFDAEAITDLALEAGMKYVNLTSRHHDSFCLFHTCETGFNSFESPAERDLVAETAEACHKKGLGLFLYYSLAADWRHPYFYPPEVGYYYARPAYDEPQSEYLWKEEKDFSRYLDFAHNQLRELLTSYGPLAGIWFDPIMGYYARPDLFPIEEIYGLIRSLQPQCLISFKQGANGDEDFATPERDAVSVVERVRKRFGLRRGKVAEVAWEKNRVKQLEICDTLAPKSWGYDSRDVDRHASAQDVIGKLRHAHSYRANLLLNTGPLGDGSILRVDRRTLREVGHLFQAEEISTIR